MGATREIEPAVALHVSSHEEREVEVRTIDVPREHAGPEAGMLAERIVLEANGWALECIESRRAEL